MDVSGLNPNTHEKQSSEVSENASHDKPAEKDGFINHAEIAWHERRRKWLGDQSQKIQRSPREQVLSWTTRYEDLLLSTEPFQEPIPLAEMVDFLVDFWYVEGLYD